MSVIGSNILAGASGQGGEYTLARSLRFRQSASGHLTRTPSSETNRKTWTWSGWIKWSLLDVSNSYNAALFTGSNTGDGIMFWTNPNTLGVLNVYLGAATYYVNTTQVFRDPSAWYHIVVAIDTTQATSSNRIKLYVNGSQVTAFSATNYPTQNYDTNVNTTGTHYIGRQNSLSRYYDGYMTEVNFIDGQALTPSSFGETNSKTGVWQPKRYTGTYGTNGFYLPFTDNSALTTSSNVGLGKDFSGNGNYWTTNNISITSGSTYDSMTDVPTLTSATASNFAVINPLDFSGAKATVTNGNLTLTSTSDSSGSTQYTTFNFPTTGKYYFEVTATTVDIGNGFGYGELGFATICYLWWVYFPAYEIVRNSGGSASIPTISNGDIIQMAIDMDAGKIWYGRNGTWLLSGDPATGTNMSLAITFTANRPDTRFYIGSRNGSSNNVFNANFGQRPFAYTPPTGFVSLNTYNLPTPTIGATASSQANKYFDATLYTGTGSAQSIVNSGGFQPALVWAKSRSNAYPNVLSNLVVGATKYLVSNNTDAETTDAGYISAINSNGFSVGTSGGLNVNGGTFVGWQWKGANTTVTNTAGSITSTVSANTTSGFSIVTYTGNGSAGATVGHGLGVAPKMLIIKARDGAGYSWKVYHGSLGSGSHLELESTGATQAGIWNSTNPSSTVFTLGTNAGVNENGKNYVCYAFADVTGYSKLGSYTGNGSSDGPFIYCGFRPKFVITKMTSSAGNWRTHDSTRSGYNPMNEILYPNLSDAEGVDNDLDFLSNGFKLRNSLAQENASGATMIYMAFAEVPTKYALGV